MDEENGKGTGMLGLVQLGLLSFFPRSRRLTAQHSLSPRLSILPTHHVRRKEPACGRAGRVVSGEGEARICSVKDIKSYIPLHTPSPHPSPPSARRPGGSEGGGGGMGDEVETAGGRY